MDNWKNISVSRQHTLLQVLDIINTSAAQFCIVLDSKNKLVGSVTDGDIRRGLLKGVQLTDTIDTVMNTAPKTLSDKTPVHEIFKIMRENKIRQIPITNEDGEIQQIVTFDELITAKQKNNNVVLMAGGLGSRLATLTENCPKPMLKVGDKPILERILKQFTEQGFVNFHFSVNYKAEIIESYFENGKNFGCNISYLKEDKKLGTAGPLSLLETDSASPVIVMNGDLLTHIDFDELLAFHSNHNSDITMCIREYDFTVPFGVVEIEDVFAKSFKEKPSFSYKVNAGIYVINPHLLQKVPKGDYYDMSSFLKTLLEEEKRIACFPIVKGWIDVGREDDLRVAQEKYSK